jgi:hypothetical protein
MSRVAQLNRVRARVTVFNNISAISWWSVLLVEETTVPGEKHRPAACHCKLYHIMLHRAGFELTTLVVIGTDFYFFF